MASILRRADPRGNEAITTVRKSVAVIGATAQPLDLKEEKDTKQTEAAIRKARIDL
jgi:hypothetical protein